MTLDEIFEKYPDEKGGFYREKKLEEIKKLRPDLSEEHILQLIPKNTCSWLKGLKSWGNEESRKLGFWIPDFMIENANASDWNIYEEDSE